MGDLFWAHMHGNLMLTPLKTFLCAYVFWCLKLEPSVVYTDYTDSVSMPLQGTQRWRDCHAFSLESLWVELLL
jgi:hypothetical protein